MFSKNVNRRRFIRAAAATAAAATVAACTAPAATTESGLPRRTLGKTGEELSVVGFGGIVVMNERPEEAEKLVAQAIERGVNYFDVAPSYGDAEEKLGPALEPYRDGAFLACKTANRDRTGAEYELERSLERLRTDHFDLYQFHAVKSLAEAERILGPGGAMEAFLDARDKGLIRYIGFSAHSEEAALAMLDRFPFDTILYPVNWACWYRGNFGPQVVAKAQEQGLGILALKALAKRALKPGETRRWPKCWYAPVDDEEEAALGLRFTLSRPVTAAVSPSHAELLWWACDAAEKLAPITAKEEEELREKSKELEPVFSTVSV